MILRFIKIAAAGVALAWANSCWALPALQLDIAGGVYDSHDETTVAQTPIFTLTALLCGPLNASKTYYISATVLPKGGSAFPSPDFGPIAINGTSYGSDAFVFGTPPTDTLAHDIPGGGIFPGYYVEIGFNFTASQTVAAYNTATDATAPGTLYYYNFTVDATHLFNPTLLGQGVLSDLYDIHFDLYDTNHNFAPYSHDASSWYSTPGGSTTVPVPVADGASTLSLMGLAALGLLGWHRRFGHRR
jgi:hypothetical protein